MINQFNKFNNLKITKIRAPIILRETRFLNLINQAISISNLF